MTKKQIAGLAVVLAVAVFLGIRIIRNAMTSDEAKIKKLIKKLTGDFEEKRFKDVFESIAEDYTDAGKHSKEDLQKQANMLIPLLRKAEVSISDLRVAVSDDRTIAEASFNAKVNVVTTLGSSKDALTDVTGTNGVKLWLRKERGKWLIYESNLGALHP